MPPAVGRQDIAVDGARAHERRLWWLACSAIAVATIILRWPLRSHYLFSWDSANFALGIARIDIAQHRPHPPGYLGYVLAARAINVVVHDANAALVIWNIAATAIAVAILARFAWESAGRAHRTLAAVGAAAILLTAPAIWFYGEIADISASELLFSSLVAYTAWRASRGEGRALYWCVAALAAAAAFKIVTAMLMAPLAVVAWTRVSPTTKRRTARGVSIALLAGAAAWLVVQPELPSIVWDLFRSSRWLFRGSTEHPMVMLNRNLRDTLVAWALGLGLVNVGATIWWLVTDRRLPSGIDRPFGLAWLLPALLLFVFVMIAKPGYLMPLVPLSVLAVSGYYARLRPAIAVTLIVVQAAVNAIHFSQLKTAAFESARGTGQYGSKTFVERMATDLSSLSTTTSSAIAQSDLRMQALLDLVAARCQASAPVVVAGADWRRVMWYLPDAAAIDVVGGRPFAVARHTDALAVADAGEELQTSCPVIWLASVDGGEGVSRPSDVLETVPHVGWLTAPGTLRVTPAAIEPIR
jgi:hypothetical protein